MDTVPFKFSDVMGGLAEAHGLLRNEGAHLCLEYQVQDGFVGVLKSAVQQVRVPIAELASVTLTQGWFGMNMWGVKILIQAKHMDVFQDIPTAVQGRVELSIARADVGAAEAFVYRLHEHDETVEEPLQG